jgi:8-oxo-dGTP diphosphatase
MKPVTRVLPPGSVADRELTYVIMGARYRGKWIFVRHRERLSWELPAGHIEAGEEPGHAARRELYEEAGVLDTTLNLISDYEVIDGSRKAFGRFYRAEVKELGPLPDHEIEEIQLSEELPQQLTYPEVQSVLFSLLSLP